MEHQYTIKGERLTLRPLFHDDIERVRQWRNQDSIRTSFIDQNIISSEQQQKWFQLYLEKVSDMMFIIEVNNQPVGAAALYNMNESSIEFGRLMIGESSALGKGIGAEASQLLVRFAINELRLQKVYLYVFANNVRAKSIYEACGFKQSGHMIRNEQDVLELTYKNAEIK
jgi:RimJ/RimL family protein N-acetyltransferase